MATVYFAKFNINENINKIHRKEVKIENILIKLFNDVNDSISFNVQEEPKEYEHDGEKKTYFGKEYYYTFSTLEKDIQMKTIAGRLVRVDKRLENTYNSETKLVEEKLIDNHAEYITFYWEVMNETIGFITKQTFGYKQIFTGLQGLLNNLLENHNVEFVLDKNNYAVRENISKFYKIRKITTVTLTHNANEEEKKKFDEKFKALEDEKVEANIEKIREEISVSKRSEKPINPSSSYVERILYGVDKCYTDIVVEGENEDGTDFKYDPRESNPFTIIIPDSIKDIISEFKREVSGKIYQVFVNRKLKDKD